jgi:hypothetical protein
MVTAKNLIQRLTETKIYRDYERAFSEATGLPVSLGALDSWQLPHRGKKQENPFCAQMAGKSRSCALCLGVQEKLARGAREPRLRDNGQQATLLRDRN